MKAFLWTIASLALFGLFGCSKPPEPAAVTFAQAADRALAEGKDGTINVGFARALGLKAERPLPLKRARFDADGATNTLNVLLEDRNTIILSERRQNLGTFYPTDRSGTLKRAIVNDGAIANGGMTNLALEAAAPDFEKLKQLWVERKAH